MVIEKDLHRRILAESQSCSPDGVGELPVGLADRGPRSKVSDLSIEPARQFQSSDPRTSNGVSQEGYAEVRALKLRRREVWIVWKQSPTGLSQARALRNGESLDLPEVRRARSGDVQIAVGSKASDRQHGRRYSLFKPDLGEAAAFAHEAAIAFEPFGLPNLRLPAPFGR